MKLCFAHYFRQYIPKGDVLQFLTLLKGIDKRIGKHGLDRDTGRIDCVLPFRFENGKDGFDFRHIRFHKSRNLARKISTLDSKINYDFIFVRGREESMSILRENERLGEKLLFLSIHYDMNDQAVMHEMMDVFKRSRITFFQSLPWANRFKANACANGISRETAEHKIQVLPQFVEALPDQIISTIPRRNPPEIVQAGIIRPRYGLNVAQRAIQLIRKEYPQVSLHLIYPFIEKEYKKEASKLLKSEGIVSYGELSLWETKRHIVRAGIGLALIYDDTQNKNPTYSYLSRILEYLSLGVPVITTKTVGNIHLLGSDYPFFVENEADIFHCYQSLTDPVFYSKWSGYCRQLGRKFITEYAVEDFWAILEKEKER